MFAHRCINSRILGSVLDYKKLRYYKSRNLWNHEVYSSSFCIIKCGCRSNQKNKILANLSYSPVSVKLYALVLTKTRGIASSGHLGGNDNEIVSSSYDDMAVPDQDTPGTRNPKRERRTLDQVIYHMQADIRRKKRIHKAEIHNAVDLIEKSLKLEGFGEFLLNSCGDTLPDLHPSYRIQLAQRIWAVIQKSGETSIGAFEAMLRTLAINEDRNQDPVSFLEEAKKSGTQPTISMYFFAMQILCQRGDIEASVNLLTSMKENGVLINEKFFNVLIVGKGRCGDIAGAVEIIDIMKGSQIVPSNDTWVALLQVYIENENRELIKKTFSEVTGAGLTESQFYNLLKLAGKSNKQEILDVVADWALESKKLRYLSIINVVLQLLYGGYLDNALNIVIKFRNELRTKAEEVGSFFIKELHAAVADPETYLRLVISLQSYNRNALNLAAESCLKHKKLSLAYAALEGMSVMGVPIRPHYFFPPLLIELEQNGVDGVIEMLKRMQSLNVKPDWDFLLNWLLPGIMNSADKIALSEALSIVRQASGLSYSSGLLNAGLAAAIELKRLNEVIVVVNTLKGKMVHPEVIFQKLGMFITTLNEDNQTNQFEKNAVILTEIINFVCKNTPPNDKRDHVGLLILRLIKSNWRSEAEIILKALQENDIAVSEYVADIVRQKLDISWNIKTNSQLVFAQGNALFNSSLSEPDVLDLECHKEELATKDFNQRGVLRKLFLKYCQTKDLQKAIETQAEFEMQYGELSTGMKSALMELYVQNNDLTSALRIYKELCMGQFEVDVYKYIDLATLLVKNDRIAEGIQIIEKECVGKQNGHPDNFSRNIVRFLQTLSTATQNSSNSIDDVFRLTELLLHSKLLTPTNPNLAPSIRDLIIRGKLDAAVSRFELYEKKYKLAPCLQELTYATLNNSMLLQRVVKCSAAVRGLRESKRLLALAKSDVGDLDGAAAIFRELGDQLSFISIIKQCEYLASNQNFDKLLNLITSLQKTERNFNCRKLYEIATRESRRLKNDVALNKILLHMQENDQFVDPSLKTFVRNCAK